MTIRILVTAVGLALMLAGPGWAQTTTTATIPTGSFASLSPGNQKIADALFAAQNTTGTTPTPLTRDQIAGLKGTEGWGRVFKQMKADGLIQAKNLGQVVSQHEHSLHAGTATTGTGSGGRAAATSRHGRMATAGVARHHGSGGFAGGHGFAGGPRMSHGFAASSMGGGVGHGGFGGMGMGGGFGGMGHGGGMGGGHGR